MVSLGKVRDCRLTGSKVGRRCEMCLQHYVLMVEGQAPKSDLVDSVKIRLNAIHM